MGGLGVFGNFIYCWLSINAFGHFEDSGDADLVSFYRFSGHADSSVVALGLRCETEERLGSVCEAGGFEHDSDLSFAGPLLLWRGDSLAACFIERRFAGCGAGDSFHSRDFGCFGGVDEVADSHAALIFLIAART